MYGKILISCTLRVETGLHIGGNGSYSAIGAVDSPVVSDPMTGRPVIPGSSLKGKMRTLLARAEYMQYKVNKEWNDDPVTILRLFGSSKNPIIPSRLQFADAFVSNAERFSEIGLTEIKWENSISRATAVANPRQIERVNRGVEFSVQIVYDVVEPDEMQEDMKNIARAMKLLQMDYLGGHGTRGSGRVSFQDIQLKPHFFSQDTVMDLEALQEEFCKVKEYMLS